MGLTHEELAAGVAAGDRRALARVLSLAERDPAAAAAVLARLAGRTGRAHVVGVTGPPGAGKSTLVGVMVRRFLELGRRVAVLAVDPSSPVTGGALLGDRFRIGESAPDDRSFIRSTATRGSLGGLTRAARQMVEFMDAAGFDLVVVETVGTGQSEVDVAGLADSILVVFPPGLGDEMQAIKAGILELADLLVVTKSDTEAAAQACRALRTVAPLWRNAPPIHPVSALSGDGIVSLVDALLARAATPGTRESGAPGRSSLERRAAALVAEFERRWPLGPAGATGPVALEVLPTATDRMTVLCRAEAGDDAFRLGAVAGVLGLLAAESGLSCAVDELDAGAGRMRLALAGAQA